jgi:hypothetical protein
LGVVDALLGHKEASISEAERAVEMLPISKDALIGSAIVTNLAAVYAWNDELDQAFGTLSPLAKIPYGIYFGQLKLDPYWEPLRKDPRFEELLTELAPKDQVGVRHFPAPSPFTLSPALSAFPSGITISNIE